MSITTNKHQASSPSIENQQNQEENLARSGSLKDKFKMNQHLMKEKFKDYLKKYKDHHPQIKKRRATEIFNFYSSDESIGDIRKIRKEKYELQERLTSNLNQYKYFEVKKQTHFKTFYKIKNKFEKVFQIRKRHSEQSQNLHKALKNVEEEIKAEKLRYKHSIDESRIRASQSKNMNCLKKSRIGFQIREEKTKYKQIIEKQKEYNFIYKKNLHEHVKTEEKQIPLQVSRVYEQKKVQANELKLQKLFREIAGHEQVKMQSSRVKGYLSNKITQLKHSTEVYDTKIREFKEQLGENPHLRMSKSIGVDIKKQSRNMALEAMSTRSILAIERLQKRSLTQHCSN